MWFNFSVHYTGRFFEFFSAIGHRGPLELGAAKTLFQRYRVGTFTPETMVKTLRARRKGSHLRLFSAGRKGQHTILLQKMFESHDKIWF